MENCIVFKSKNNNNYLFNQKKRKILPLHPELFQIIDHYLENDNVNWDNYQYSTHKSYFDFLLKHEILDRKLLKPFPNKTESESIINDINQVDSITIDVTDRCNLNCYYCAFGTLYANTPRNQGDIPFEYITSLFNYLDKKDSFSSLQTKTINIGFYGGEPLLAIDLIKKTIQYIKENYESKYIKFTYGFTTNGILLDKEIDFLVNNKFKIAVSLDGNERHNAYRVDFNKKNSFNRILKNLSNIKEKYPEFYEENLTIFTVLHNKNPQNEVDKFIKGVLDKTPRYSDISEIDANPLNKSELHEISKNKFSENNNTVYGDQAPILHSERGKNDNYYINYQSLLEIKKETSKVKCFTGTCRPFTNKIYLKLDGKIYPCEKISESDHLGKIENGEVIINTDEIANEFNKRFNALWDRQCSRCYNVITCSKCIFSLEGDLSDKQICTDFLNKKAFIKNIENSFQL